MTAEHLDQVVASIIAEAAKSMIDWDATPPATVAVILRSAVGRLDVSSRQRETLIGIAASAINAVLALDRRQGGPRRPATPPVEAAPMIPPRPTSPPMQDIPRGAWGRPLDPEAPKPRLPFADQD